MSPWLHLSGEYWRESKLWIYQLRQPALVYADHLPAHHLGLLGERVQHGKKVIMRLYTVNKRDLFVMLHLFMLFIIRVCLGPFLIAFGKDKNKTKNAF